MTLLLSLILTFFVDDITGTYIVLPTNNTDGRILQLQ